MELKWLEDFVSLAASRSFSRAAEERNVTQPAFSRRIKALETWLGAELVDRGSQPPTLTEAGLTFLETAQETVRALHASRASVRAKAMPRALVSIAALHSLSLRFFPHWIREIEAATGPLDTRLLPDGLQACLKAITEGGFDFMLMLSHEAVPILLDPLRFPHLVVGIDAFVAVRCATPVVPDTPLPLLGYPDDLLLGRMTAFAQTLDGSPQVRPSHTNDSAIALKFMVLEGHGFAWLPRSLIAEELASGVLIAVAPEIAMEVRLYRSARHTRAVIESVWTAASHLAAKQHRSRME